MMNFFKKLSHEAKVLLAVVGSAIIPLVSDPAMLTALISSPWSVAIPAILPKLIATGSVGGALYNMLPKKQA
jgi:hypothetical protein